MAPSSVRADASLPLPCLAKNHRRRPGQPSAVLPATPAFVVMETAAQLWAQTGDPFAAEMGLRLVVAFRAASLGWEGCAPYLPLRLPTGVLAHLSCSQGSPS